MSPSIFGDIPLVHFMSHCLYFSSNKASLWPNRTRWGVTHVKRFIWRANTLSGSSHTLAFTCYPKRESHCSLQKCHQAVKGYYLIFFTFQLKAQIHTQMAFYLFFFFFTVQINHFCPLQLQLKLYLHLYFTLPLWRTKCSNVLKVLTLKMTI